MNPLTLTLYNRTQDQHDLTLKSFESARAQDIPTTLFVYDNGSTFPATCEWLAQISNPPHVYVWRERTNIFPTGLANRFLAEMFDRASHVLCMPNDVILPPNFYRELLKWPRGVVTASETRDRNYDLATPITVTATSENTPMAVLLLRKWAYDALLAKDGYFFDERFEHYCSDNDAALRLSACGIRGVQLNLLYYHYGSASIRLNEVWEQARLHQGGDADRQRFLEKWHFRVDAPAYSEAAHDINFRGEGQS